MPGDTPIIDTFTRADAANLGTNWTVDPGHFNAGPLKIVSNVATGSGTGTDATDNEEWWNQATFGPDCEAYVTIAINGVNDVNGLYLHLISPGTASVKGYFVRLFAGGGNLQYYRIDNGTFTQLGALTLAGTIANNDTWLVYAHGPVLEVWRRPSGGSYALIDSRTDGTYLGMGFIGIASEFTADSSLINFGGGTTTAVIWPRRGNSRRKGPRNLPRGFHPTRVPPPPPAVVVVTRRTLASLGVGK